MQLKKGTLLQGGKYRIEEVLGQGGFGITYLGEQTSLIRKVAIKEFFIKELCNRDAITFHVSVGSEGSLEMVTRFKEKFVKEARNIAKLKHPNIVSVIDVFEENGTAYYVMDYCECGSLSALLKEKYPNGMPENLAMKYIREIAAALDYVHKRNINHLDVKPANIMLGDMGEAVLIDFGLSKQYDAETGNQTSTTPVGISEGYAPMEQYRKGGVGQFSPSVDIYSLGATMYKMLTGKTPPDAFVVNENGLPFFQASKTVSNAIIAAMKPRRNERPQNITTWLQLLTPISPLIQNDAGNKDDVNIVCGTKPFLQKKQKWATTYTKQTRFKTTNQGKRWILYSIIAIVLAAITMILGGRRYAGTTTQTDSDYQAIDTSNIVVEGGNDKQVKGNENGHEWVDLGLSVCWATCNVGASVPEEFGDYFSWGETKRKSHYEFENCFDCINGDRHKWNQYKIGGKTYITANSGHDTARENWGGNWRMPTDKENLELYRKCKWVLEKINGHFGYTITGPNGNTIFLPAGGDYMEWGQICTNEGGSYWSSILSPDYSDEARCLVFSDKGVTITTSLRYCGQNVRPVKEK